MTLKEKIGVALVMPLILMVIAGVIFAVCLFGAIAIEEIGRFPAVALGGVVISWFVGMCLLTGRGKDFGPK